MNENNITAPLETQRLVSRDRKNGLVDSHAQRDGSMVIIYFVHGDYFFRTPVENAVLHFAGEDYVLAAETLDDLGGILVDGLPLERGADGFGVVEFELDAPFDGSVETGSAEEEGHSIGQVEGDDVEVLESQIDRTSLSWHREWNILSLVHLMATRSKDETTLLVSLSSWSCFMSWKVMVSRVKTLKVSWMPSGNWRVTMCFSWGSCWPISKLSAMPE